jgi:hypothetical protein
MAPGVSEGKFSAIMTTSTCVIVALQIIQFAQVVSLHATHNTSSDAELRKALVTLGTLFVISMAGRIAAACMWILGTVNGRRLYTFYYGKSALLAASSISAYATMVAVGAVTVHMSVITKYRKVDPNIDAVAVVCVIALVLVFLETGFAHSLHSTKRKTTLRKISWKELPHVLVIVVTLASVLLLLCLSMAFQTLVYAKLGTCTVAPDLSESDAVRAAQLHRALQGGRLLSFVTVTLTALLIVMYTMKGVFPIADQSSKMGNALFFVSALVWVFTSIAYGTVLPGANCSAKPTKLAHQSVCPPFCATALPLPPQTHAFAPPRAGVYSFREKESEESGEMQ